MVIIACEQPLPFDKIYVAGHTQEKLAADMGLDGLRDCTRPHAVRVRHGTTSTTLFPA